MSRAAPASNAALTFSLLGGPLAWFVQLCAGYALSSWPCFPQDLRRPLPLPDYGWTSSAIALVSLAAFVIALAASLTGARAMRRNRAGEPAVRDSNRGGRIEATVLGRRCFLALWGCLAGAGFAVAIAFTAVQFWLLPRCAG